MSRPRRAKVVAIVEQPKPLLICNGQFFVFTTKEVQVHVLSDPQTALFWDGLSIADTRSERTTQMHREYVVRQHFGSEAIGFLPAGTAEALFHYVEHYEGPLTEEIKGLAACILSGTPYGPDNAQGGRLSGGEKVTSPVAPQTPSGPNGATFSVGLGTEREEWVAEQEIRQIEGSMA
jgi:hypothetical protein